MEKEYIIFLHGIVGNKNAFKKEIKKLKVQYNCISYDFYCPVELGKNEFSLEFLVDQLYRQYKKNHILEAHLCALSFGSIVASAFAKKYPSMVKSLTFVGGYLCGVPAQIYRNVEHLLEIKHQFTYRDWVKSCSQLFNPNVPMIPEDSEKIFEKYALELEPKVFERVLRMQIEIDSEKVITKLNHPILWIMGEYDELFKETLLRLHHYVPHIEYHELKDAGHAAHAHQHETFMSLFQSFLARNTIFLAI